MLYVVIASQLATILGRRVWAKVLAGVVGASVAPVVALALADMAVAGLVMGFSYAVQFTPAVRAVLRSASAGGVAPLTRLMAWVEALAWFAYGLGVADPALVIGGGGGTVMSSVILVRLARIAGPGNVTSDTALLAS